MLTQIDVDSENAFEIPLATATPKDSLVLQKVTGLNAPDVNLFIGDYARDGGTYQGRRVGSRNVVFYFDLNPNPALGETTSGLRSMLQKAFMDPQVEGDFLKITLHDDFYPDRYLVGFTEKIEGEPFGQDTIQQISMICPDPYIRDVTETALIDATGWTLVPFTYAGTADTGFSVEIHLTASTSALTLDNNGKTMVMNYAFLNGDVVNLSTVPGERLLTLTRGGVTTSILGSLTPASPWLQLHSQANTMRLYGATTGDIVGAVRSLTYRQAYWGA